MYARKEKIYTAYVSKNSSNCEKQIIFLMILSWEMHKEREAKSEGRQQWDYLAVWMLSAFLWGIASKNDGDFYCLNCLHFFRRKNKLELKERESEDKEFRILIMPFEHTNILKLNQYKKSDEAPFIIYSVIESI